MQKIMKHTLNIEIDVFSSSQMTDHVNIEHEWEDFEDSHEE